VSVDLFLLVLRFLFLSFLNNLAHHISLEERSKANNMSHLAVNSNSQGALSPSVSPTSLSPIALSTSPIPPSSSTGSACSPSPSQVLTPYNKLEYSDWRDIPEYRVAPTKRNIHITKVQGPRSLAGGKKDFFATKFGEVIFKGRTVSTYPRFRGTARQVR